MKKKYIVFDSTAMLFLIGAYFTKHFTDRKLGFVRWLNFNGAKLRESFPTETVKYIAAAFCVILAAIALCRLLKRYSMLSLADKIMAAVMIAAAIYYCYATIAIVSTVTPCSFLLVPMIGLASFCFTLRNLTRAGELSRHDK